MRDGDNFRLLPDFDVAGLHMVTQQIRPRGSNVAEQRVSGLTPEERLARRKANKKAYEARRRPPKGRAILSDEEKAKNRIESKKRQRAMHQLWRDQRPK